MANDHDPNGKQRCNNNTARTSYECGRYNLAARDEGEQVFAMLGVDVTQTACSSRRRFRRVPPLGVDLDTHLDRAIPCFEDRVRL